MTILLFILKLLGILFAVMVGIVIFLFLAVFCVPVRYRLEGYEGEERCFTGKLHWLLHMVSVTVSYQKDGMVYVVRLLGVPILPRKEKKILPEKEEEASESRTEAEGAEEEASESRTKAEGAEAGMPESRTEAEGAEAGTPESRTGPKKKISSGKKGRWNRMERFIQKINESRNILFDEKNKKALSFLWRELKYLLRHSGFRKIKTDLTFSMGDPALTGQVLGIMSLFPVLYRKEVHVSSDFEDTHIYIRGNYYISGYVRLLHFLRSGIRLWNEKEFRWFVNQIIKK